jgi:hypothetical protein
MNLLVFASPQIQRGGGSSSTDALHCGTLKIIHKKAKASELKRRALGCLREKCGAGEDEFVRFACWGWMRMQMTWKFAFASKTRHGRGWFAAN